MIGKWWFIPVLLALKSLRQENLLKFKDSLGYTVRLSHKSKKKKKR